MAEISAVANRQIRDLETHYATKNRPEAIALLGRAVQDALRAAYDPTTRYRNFPATHRTLASLNMRWIKVHRYRFAYVPLPAVNVLTNVIYETADIPRRSRPYV